MPVEGGRGDGTERSAGSCASGLFDSAEDSGISVHGVSQGEVGDQGVQELSGLAKEAVLGQSFLGERVFCQHGWDGRGDDPSLCSLSGAAGKKARASTSELRSI